MFTPLRSKTNEANDQNIEANDQKLQATRAMAPPQAPRAEIVQEMTKVIPCWMKLHSRLLTRRKLPRKYQKNLPKSST